MNRHRNGLAIFDHDVVAAIDPVQLPALGFELADNVFTVHWDLIIDQFWSIRARERCWSSVLGDALAHDRNWGLRPVEACEAVGNYGVRESPGPG